MPDWPADHIRRWPIDALIPYARNSRVHTPEQIDQIANSIQSFGWTIPVLADEDGTLIAGHARILAAQKLGLLEVPVMTANGWSAEKKAAYVIADNKLSLNATWDDDLLRSEFGMLQTAGFDLGLTGFGQLEIATLFAPVTDPMAEWQGMPTFDQPDNPAFKTIAMHFKDQAAVDAFAELIRQPITAQTRFLWYPQIEIMTAMDKRYVTTVPAAEAA